MITAAMMYTLGTDARYSHAHAHTQALVQATHSQPQQQHNWGQSKTAVRSEIEIIMYKKLSLKSI